jgi:hypothetical protein
MPFVSHGERVGATQYTGSMKTRKAAPESEARPEMVTPHYREVTVQALDVADPLIPEAEAARILMISRWSLMRLRKRRKILLRRPATFGVLPALPSPRGTSRNAPCRHARQREHATLTRACKRVEMNAEGRRKPAQSQPIEKLIVWTSLTFVGIRHS